MIKLFISQPMNGKTDEEILKERETAVNEARKALNDEVEVLETFFDLGEGKKPLHYLAKSIEFLADADVVYFVEGWNKARGCRLEHMCALAYGVRCLYPPQ